MRKKAIEKILALIDNLPEKKLGSLVDYAEYLREKEDVFTEDEKILIRKARKEAVQGKGVEWRKIKKANV
ncbi:MAG: hypothetical protein QMD05_04790 [Candidatus Brocadiaceae bacterium]|nr:hypothetical protein [Candidatus Brocadiaceae bacterium]